MCALSKQDLTPRSCRLMEIAMMKLSSVSSALRPVTVGCRRTMSPRIDLTLTFEQLTRPTSSVDSVTVAVMNKPLLIPPHPQSPHSSPTNASHSVDPLPNVLTPQPSTRSPQHNTPHPHHLHPVNLLYHPSSMTSLQNVN